MFVKLRQNKARIIPIDFNKETIMKINAISFRTVFGNSENVQKPVEDKKNEEVSKSEEKPVTETPAVGTTAQQIELHNTKPNLQPEKSTEEKEEDKDEDKEEEEEKPASEKKA